MTQRIIHSADWQLGRAFSGFGPDLGPQLRQARIDAIESLAELAREQGAEQVLVAGDVFDTETPSNATLLAALEAVGRAPGLTWRLLPGNHDPLATTGGGLWERVAREAPPNLRLHLEPRPEEIAPDLWLLPAPWPNKAPGRDLTAWMESAATPAGALRIGLAHGPTKRFGAAEAAGALIPPDRADSAGLAYLALGDWHGVQQAGPRAWYAGTPEPDRFPRNRPGCALVVAPRGPDAEPDVAAVGVARFDWRAPALRLTPEADPVAALEAALAPTADQAERFSRRRTLVSLTLTGAATLAGRAEVAARIAALSEGYAHFEADLDGLDIVGGAADLDAAGLLGAARLAAERLVAETADPDLDAAARGDARRALDRLLSYAARPAFREGAADRPRAGAGSGPGGRERAA